MLFKNNCFTATYIYMSPHNVFRKFMYCILYSIKHDDKEMACFNSLSFQTVLFYCEDTTVTHWP